MHHSFVTPLIFTLFFFCTNIQAMNLFQQREDSSTSVSKLVEHHHIAKDSLDELVIAGIRLINSIGYQFKALAGNGIQAYNVTYTLLNPRNRLHLLRQPCSTRYLCRELLAYFKGSLQVNEGLAQASKIWQSLADEKGCINSNYGYYVFHQRVPEFDNKTQYEWVISCLLKNPDSRKAFININQPLHKRLSSKDFPCTLGMQFFIQEKHLCSVISSRSTDIFTGLPYDMGFFSLVTELVYQDLKERNPTTFADLQLGYTSMKTNFTQIYDKKKKNAFELLKSPLINDANNIETLNIKMPRIESAQDTLHDIYNETQNSPIMKWIYTHAQLN